ncbi:hypothetical protein GW17_00059058, partial [Ensete ventricosum]
PPTGAVALMGRPHAGAKAAREHGRLWPALPPAWVAAPAVGVATPWQGGYRRARAAAGGQGQPSPTRGQWRWRGKGG